MHCSEFKDIECFFMHAYALLFEHDGTFGVQFDDQTKQDSNRKQKNDADEGK